MNEQIQELAEQSYNEFYNIRIDLEKFTKLVINKVIDKAEDYGLGVDAVEQLRADFGVKE